MIEISPPGPKTNVQYDESFLIGPRIQKQDLIQLVNERKFYATTYYQTFMKKVRRWYDFYRGIYTGIFPSYRNNIHIPLLFSVVWSDVAYKVQTSFGQTPLVGFQGVAPEDSLGAKKIETLVSTQFEDADSFRKAVAFYASADIYGTAIARVGWRHDAREHKFRVKMLDREVIHKGKVLEFDGPDWDVVDILDFWPQPGKTSLAKCSWVIHRYYMDLDDILMDQMSPNPLFDKKAVDELLHTPMNLPMINAMRERLNVYKSFSEYQAKSYEAYSRPVEICEMWGMVPREFAINGCRDVVITVANEKVILRYEPNPFWRIKFPFHVYCPMPDPHYFHGTGKVEVGEKMQAASNRIINQKLDALDLFIDPMFVVSRSANVDFQNLFSRPGRIFQIDGAVDDTQFRAFSPNLEGLKLAYTELEALSQQIQRGTGMVDDVAQGLKPGGDRETARSFMARREAVMSRIGLEARYAEKTFIEPMANDFYSLNQQFLTLPRQVQILGSSALINPSSGLPVPQQAMSIDAADMTGSYKARALGATQMLTKSLRGQNLMLALQAVGSNPVGMQITNWVSFFTDFYRTLDLDPNQLIVQGAIPAINAFADAREMSPEQLVEMVSKQMQSLPQLAPGQLGPQEGSPIPNMQLGKPNYPPQNVSTNLNATG